MKKINFFYLALIACCLTFVACEKDEDEINDGNATDEINDGNATNDGNAVVTLTFNGTKYSMGYYTGLFDKEGTWIKGYERRLRFAPCYDIVEDGGFNYLINPYLNIYANYDKSSKTYIVDEENSEFFYDSEKVRAISEDIDEHDDNGELVEYSDWTIFSVNSASIEFDADDLSFGCNLDMMMFDEYGYQFDESGADRPHYADVEGALKRLTVVATDCKFELVKD